MAHKATRQEHPLPAVIMHWIHLISLGVLIWTGFFIHSPFYQGGMSINRTLHFIFMWVFISTATVRVYWAFFGAGSAPPGERRKIRDYKFFLPEAKNRGKFGPMLAYYLFLRKTHPSTSKYNPLQKATYILWLFLIIFQAITGFALWTPTSNAFQSVAYYLGGLESVRNIHFLVMWVFIVTVVVHIYLVLVEAIQQLPLMFLWREMTSKRGVVK